MFETRRGPGRILLSCFLIAITVASGIPAGIWGMSPESPTAGAVGRAITDSPTDLIIPEGENYTLFGVHNFTGSIQINGTLNVSAYDGINNATGTLALRAPSITIGPLGSIIADGRGFGGGGGGTAQSSTTFVGGKAGRLGLGGDGAIPSTSASGGGGGSEGGLGGISASYGNGQPGIATKGGDGGVYSSYTGGRGGTGYGGGGGGGTSATNTGGGGGGGGGTGGADALNIAGGYGGGPFAGVAGQSFSSGYSASMDARNGGYLACETNGEQVRDIKVYRGSGGGGGGAANLNTGGAGAGGAGGGSVSLIADGNLAFSGTISTRGGGGGTGGWYSTTGYAGKGGGGAGGGILLSAQRLIMAGTLDARGRDGNFLTVNNSGTIKMLFSDQFSSGTSYTGNLYVNSRPKVNELLEPESGTQTVVRPTFKWVPAFDVEDDSLTYQVQVSTSPQFGSLRLDRTGIVGEQYTPDIALNGKEFSWRVRAWDPYGPGSWSDVWKILVDSSPPKSAMDPLPEFETSKSFDLTWTGSDNDAVWYYLVYFSDNGGGYKQWLKTLNTSCIFTGEDGHIYSFFTVAADTSENMESAPAIPDATTSIDTSPPAAWFVNTAPFQNRLIFPVGWNGSDPTSGVGGYTIFASDNGGPYNIWLENTPETTALYKGKEGHEYSFYIIARDITGNVQPAPQAKDIWTTKVDTLSPATAVLPSRPFFASDPMYITPETVISLGATSDYSGLSKTQFFLDGNQSAVVEYTGPFNETVPGPHNITVWSVDKAGNQETPHTIDLWVDDMAPTSALSFIGPSYTREGTFFVSSETKVLVSSSDEASGVARVSMVVDGVPMDYKTPFRLLKGGLHTIKSYAVDNVGHIEEERTENVIVDIWPPFTLAEGPTGMQRRSVTLNLVGSDLESGMAQPYYRITKEGNTPMSFSPGSQVFLGTKEDHSSDGTYTVDFYSVDNVGNPESFRSVSVTIDTLASMTVDLNPSITTDSSTLTVRGTAEPGASLLINGKFVLVRNDGTFSYSVELGRGKNKLIISMTDEAGNAVSETHFATYTPAEGLPSWFMPLAAVVCLTVAAAICMMVFMRSRRMKQAGY